MTEVYFALHGITDIAKEEVESLFRAKGIDFRSELYRKDVLLVAFEGEFTQQLMNFFVSRLTLTKRMCFAVAPDVLKNYVFADFCAYFTTRPDPINVALRNGEVKTGILRVRLDVNRQLNEQLKETGREVSETLPRLGIIGTRSITDWHGKKRYIMLVPFPSYTQRFREEHKTPFVMSGKMEDVFAKLLINLSEVKEDGLVLDCFGGVGTTCMEALKLGLRSAYVEVNPTIFSWAETNINVLNSREECVKLLRELENFLDEKGLAQKYGPLRIENFLAQCSYSDTTKNILRFYKNAYLDREGKIDKDNFFAHLRLIAEGLKGNIVRFDQLSRSHIGAIFMSRGDSVRLRKFVQQADAIVTDPPYGRAVNFETMATVMTSIGTPFSEASDIVPQYFENKTFWQILMRTLFEMNKLLQLGRIVIFTIPLYHHGMRETVRNAADVFGFEEIFSCAVPKNMSWPGRVVLKLKKKFEFAADDFFEVEKHFIDLIIRRSEVLRLVKRKLLERLIRIFKDDPLSMTLELSIARNILKKEYSSFISDAVGRNLLPLPPDEEISAYIEEAKRIKSLLIQRNGKYMEIKEILFPGLRFSESLPLYSEINRDELRRLSGIMLLRFFGQCCILEKEPHDLSFSRPERVDNSIKEFANYSIFNIPMPCPPLYTPYTGQEFYLSRQGGICNKNTCRLCEYRSLLRLALPPQAKELYLKVVNFVRSYYKWRYPVKETAIGVGDVLLGRHLMDEAGLFPERLPRGAQKTKL